MTNDNSNSSFDLQYNFWPLPPLFIICHRKQQKTFPKRSEWEDKKMSSNPRPLRRPPPSQRSLPEPPTLPSRPSSARQQPSVPAPPAITERKTCASAPLPTQPR